LSQEVLSLKRLVSFFIFIAILLSISNVYAEEPVILDFNYARTMMINNSNTLKDLQRTINKTYKQYTDTVKSSEKIDTVKTTVIFMGEEYTVYFNNLTRMMLEKQKEMMPLVMENSWLTVKENETVMKNRLVQGLRGLYLALYSARENLRIKEESYQIAQSLNQQEHKKFELGVISRIALDESDFKLLEAKVEYNEARRNYENALRSFNNYIGVPLYVEYDEIIYDESFDASGLKNVEYYVSLALKARSEIRQLERQIRIKETDREISERYGLHNIYPDLGKEYGNLLLDIERLQVELERTKANIEKEIRDVYLALDTERKSVVKLSKTLELQKNNLDLIKARFEAGLVTASVVEQTENAVRETENAYRLAVYNYNTRLMKFRNAIGTGPAFSQ